MLLMLFLIKFVCNFYFFDFQLFFTYLLYSICANVFLQASRQFNLVHFISTQYIILFNYYSIYYYISCALCFPVTCQKNNFPKLKLLFYNFNTFYYSTFLCFKDVLLHVSFIRTLHTILF